MQMLSSNKTKTFIAAFLVSLITILVFLPALQNDFVDWDDGKYVIDNSDIRSIDLSFFKWSFSSFDCSNWHPLTWLSHALDYAVWGANPMGHHLTSIVFHGLNTFLVVILIILLVQIAQSRKKLNSFNVPLIAGVVTGLLFGLHPLHVESVVWISERKDLLCAFFFLLSILSYLNYSFYLERYPSARQRKYYILCLLFFTLALMSKPMAVTLPVVLLIFDFYLLKRFSWHQAFSTHRRVLIEKLPFFVLSMASSAITIMAQRAGDAISESVILIYRILQAFNALIFYLYKMFWPTGLAPLYPYPTEISLFSLEYSGAFILAVCITTGCILTRKKQNVFSAVWAYYVITLLPVLGIIQVGAQAAADRYTYLPSIGVMFLIGLGTASLWDRAETSRNKQTSKAVSIVVIIFVVSAALSALTIKQTSIWKNSLTLWNAELEMFPIYTVYNNRGSAYGRQKDHALAIADYDKAIELNPSFADAYFNRGWAYEKSGDNKKAMDDYNMATMIDPDNLKAYLNRGNLHARAGNLKNAISDYNEAIKRDPDSVTTYLSLAALYERMNAFTAAIKIYDKVIELDPLHTGVYNNRGIDYAEMGDYRKAIQDFTSAINLDKMDATAYFNRGHAYKRLNDNVQAEKDLLMADIIEQEGKL